MTNSDLTNPDMTAPDTVAPEAPGGPESAEPAALAAAAGLTFALAPGHRVKVRKGPGTDYPVVRLLPEGSRIQIHCQQHGERVSGPYGTTDLWDSIAPGQYVSDSYVHTGSSGMVAPSCTG
ncbi:peptidase [Streptomyces sp. NPDC056411]|uniref:peptidase n=2 Tax=unclassified Streptomyces TaxID=2593676 RepID=UPI0035E378EF